MSFYYEYELEDGISILVESDDKEGGLVNASRNDIPIVKAKKKFAEAFKEVKAQAKLLIKEIEELQVSEAEIKFGISSVGEFGNMAIGKVGMGVNYEVTLKWKKKEIK